jgi:indoleamine 2,3-dioxygenase
MKKVRAWRGKHIAVVSKYIVQPAKEAMNAGTIGKSEGPGAGEMQGDDSEMQGTGGAALIPFLRQARDETVGIAN